LAFLTTWSVRFRTEPTASSSGSDSLRGFFCTGSSQRSPELCPSASCDRDLLRQVHILNRVEQLDALLERSLERLAPRDQAHPTGALVDHRGHHGVAQIVLTGGAAAIDEADPPHVAVGDLVAREVDRIVGGELGVDLLVSLAKPLERGVVV